MHNYFNTFFPAITKGLALLAGNLFLRDEHTYFSSWITVVVVLNCSYSLEMLGLWIQCFQFTHFIWLQRAYLTEDHNICESEKPLASIKYWNWKLNLFQFHESVNRIVKTLLHPLTTEGKKMRLWLWIFLILFKNTSPFREVELPISFCKMHLKSHWWFVFGLVFCSLFFSLPVKGIFFFSTTIQCTCQLYSSK